MADVAAGGGLPIVYFDALRVKVREDCSVKNLAC